jgi:hypothetical protein
MSAWWDLFSSCALYSISLFLVLVPSHSQAISFASAAALQIFYSSSQAHADVISSDA